MTTPDGASNLPTGTMTLENIASKLSTAVEDIQEAASELVPSIFSSASSTAGDILSNLSPFGIITNLWSEFTAFVAAADTADIDSLDDLPALLLEFIEGLPVIGQLVGLVEAILGTYDGDDEILLKVQELFAPIRAVLSWISGSDGFPTLGEITTGISNFFQAVWDAIIAALTGTDSDGNSTSLLSKVLAELSDKASGALQLASDAASLISDLGSLIQQLVNDDDDAETIKANQLIEIVTLPLQILIGIAKLAITSGNPSSSSLESRIAALEAENSGNAGWFDDFNGDTLDAAKWGALGGLPSMRIEDGHVINGDDGVVRGNEYIGKRAATTKYKITWAVTDMAYGSSRAIIAADSAFSSFCVMEMDHNASGTDIYLGYGTDPDSAPHDFTIHAEYHFPPKGKSTYFQPGYVLMLQCQEDVPSAGQNTFTVYYKGLSDTDTDTAVCTWVDDANVVGTDGTDGHRRCAVVIGVDDLSLRPGCGIDAFAGSDIP